MKTKILTVAALSAVFLINAAFAATGSLSLGYGSDFFRRGSLLSKDSLQAAASYSTQVQGVTASANVQTAHGNENLEDAYMDAAYCDQMDDTIMRLNMEILELESELGRL